MWRKDWLGKSSQELFLYSASAGIMARSVFTNIRLGLTCQVIFYKLKNIALAVVSFRTLTELLLRIRWRDVQTWVKISERPRLWISHCRPQRKAQRSVKDVKQEKGPTFIHVNSYLIFSSTLSCHLTENGLCFRQASGNTSLNVRLLPARWWDT